MAGFLNVFAALEQDDSEIINSIATDNDDNVIVFTIVATYMRNNLNRSIGFFENTIPPYLSWEFSSHFRMTRQTFELLAREIMATGRIPQGNPFGRPPVPPEKQILLVLWAIGNQETHRSVADQFDLTKSSAHRAMHRVTQALLDILPQYIKWPTGEYIYVY